MAIVVPSLVVIGLALFVHGLFRILLDNDASWLTGKILIALSLASISLGGLGALSAWR